MPLRTFTTAGVNNLWSNAANWDTGVPANTDTFLIPLGQTAEFDVNQSGFAAGIAGTVNGELTLTATAGTYYFKQNGAVVGTGTISAGSAVTPLAFAAKHTWDLNGQVIGIAGGATSPKMLIYCTNPTNRYIALSGAEAAGQTELSVGTDVTGDIWAVGDTVVLVDYTLTRDVETAVIAAGGIDAAHIDVTAGIGAAKVQGCRMYLLTRHIRFINAPAANCFLTIQPGSYVRAEVSGGTTDTIFKTCTGCTFDGIGYSAITTTAFAIQGNTNCTLSGILLSSATSGYLVDGTTTGLNVTTTGIVSAGPTGLQGNLTNAFRNTTFNGEAWQASTALLSNLNGLTCLGAKFTMSPLGVYDCNGAYFDDCDFTGCTTAMSTCARVMAVDCVTAGGTTDLDCVTGSFFNCTMASATEHANYNLMEPWQFTSSEQHDGAAGAFVGWSKGGICVSNVVTVPPGITRSYQHLYESATLWNLRQYTVRLLAGAKITVTWYLRKDVAIGVAGDRPTVQIINPFADPMVNSADVPLATATMTDAVNTWETGQITYTNTGTIAVDVIIRALSRSAGPGTNYYEVTGITYSGGGMAAGSTYLDATI